MSWRGLYINLDRNLDRRTEIEAELVRHSFSNRYRRFPAAEGNALNFPNPHLSNGEIGCFTSHYQILKENLNSTDHLHIVEDDILFSAQTAPVMDWAIAQGFLEQYDIVFTDVFVPLLNDALKNYKKLFDAAVAHDASGAMTRAAFSIVNMKDMMLSSTCAMLVSKKAIAKLHDLYGECLSNQPRLPIDLFLRNLTQRGVITTGTMFPFITSIRLDRILSTNMAARQDTLSALAASIARYSFFIDANMAECQKMIDQYLPLAAQNQRSAVLNQLLAFSLTDAYTAP
jgi:GR25 family glycosyltransferase involved in LPS biosynthesis